MPLDKEQRKYLSSRLGGIFNKKLAALTVKRDPTPAEIKAMVEESGYRVITQKEFLAKVLELRGGIPSVYGKNSRPAHTVNETEYSKLYTAFYDKQNNKNADRVKALRDLHTKLLDKIILGDDSENLVALLAEMESFETK